MNITRDDLRVKREDNHWETRPVTDEEFDRLAREAGFVKAVQYPMDGLYAVSEDGQAAWKPTDAQILRALLTDECEGCGGSGQQVSKVTGREIKFTCPDCGGRGWLPKPGVMVRLDGPLAGSLVISADWLETEDE